MSELQLGGFTGRTSKRIATTTIALGLLLAMVAAAFRWFELDVPINGVPQRLDATGIEGVTALFPVLLATLAALLALVMAAGRWSRFLIAMVISGLCVAAVMLTVNASQNGADVFVDQVNTLTATSTAQAARDVITDGTVHTTTPVWVSLAGMLTAWLGSLAAMITCATWPTASHRYDRDASTAAASNSSGDDTQVGSARDRAADRHIDQWDELSGGGDPTAR